MKNNRERPFTFFIICFLTMVIGSASAQNSVFDHKNARWDEFSFNFQDNFQDSLALWPERVLLQLANRRTNTYTPIFFKAYLFSGNLSVQNGKSGVLNIELLDDDGALLKRQFHKIVNGMVQGQLELPRNIVSGRYTLKAYTRWSQNYGPDFAAKEQFQIGELSQDEKSNGVSEVFILPEGGTFLSDQKNRLVIGTSDDSLGKGRIVDENNREVAKVSFYSSDLGTAILQPKQGKRYRLQMEDGTFFMLPKAETEGCLLHVNNLDEEYAKIHITASDKVLEQEVTLIGTSGGIKYFEKKLNFDDGNTLDVELLKTNFPAGIFTLRLVDNLGAELAKRPIFIKGKKLQIAVEPIGLDSETDMKTYRIKVRDLNNKPVKSRLAISVNEYDADYEGYLDLETVRHKDSSTNTSGSTHTLSRRKESFLKDLEALLSNAKEGEQTLTEGNTRFPFQKGLEIVGHAYDLNNQLLSNTTIQFFAKSEEEIWLGEAQSDAQGIVRLEDIQIEGRATLVTRTKGSDVASRLVQIVPIDMMEERKNVLLPYMKKNKEQANTEPYMDVEPFGGNSEKTIELEEIEIVEKAPERKKMSPSIYGIDVPSNRIKLQDPVRPKSFVQLLAELPGVVVSGAETLNPSVRVTSASGPILWVLDGFPLSQGGGKRIDRGYGGNTQNQLMDVMALTSARDIERIELLVGADASIYGTRGSGGVIAIYTRRGDELEYVPRKESELVFEGYMPTLDFNDYVNELSKRKENKLNLSYWNPNLETDDNGEAIIQVPKKKDLSRIKVEISAISTKGRIGMASKVF